MKNTMKRFVAALLCLMMAVACISVASAEAAYTAGTYTAVANGFGGPVTVEVTFSDDAITGIVVTDNNETPGIGTTAIDRLPGEIVASQSLGVDVITGATFASNAILEAVADAVGQAGGDAEALKAVEVVKVAGETIEMDVDVVVVGAGGAGMAAAASAAENGAKVVVLEKTAAVGGNTLASGLAMNAADPEVAATMDTLNGQVNTLTAVLDYDPADFGDYADTLVTAQAQITEYLAGDTSKAFDSTEWHIIQTYLGGKRTDVNGNPVAGQFDLVSNMCANSLETYNWLINTVGIMPSTTMTSPVGSLWLRGHNFDSKPNVFSASIAYIESFGGEVMVDTKAEHLIVDNGAVVGVEAVKADGTPVILHAKSVILTTGGFGANSEMVAQYNTYWPAIPEGVMTTCVAAATGDGINLALEAGAALKDMGLTQLMPTASAVTGQLADGLLVPSQYYMFVNQEGNRFVNEYAERDTLAFAALSQTGGVFYHIADQEMIPTLQNRATQEMVDDMVAKGIIYKADTLEDLAAQIGCPADALIASVTTYNSYVDSGVDADFGKGVFGTKIETAPFYAVIEKPSVHHTMGGVAINTNAEVLNENGEAIPGLYAAGEVTGGIHAGNRLGGNAIADCFVYGKIAGANAAK